MGVLDFCIVRKGLLTNVRERTATDPVRFHRTHGAKFKKACLEKTGREWDVLPDDHKKEFLYTWLI